MSEKLRMPVRPTSAWPWPRLTSSIRKRVRRWTPTFREGPRFALRVYVRFRKLKLTRALLFLCHWLAYGTFASIYALARGTSRLASSNFVGILHHLGKLGLLIAVATFIYDFVCLRPDRETQALHKMLTSGTGTKRIRAIERLHDRREVLYGLTLEAAYLNEICIPGANLRNSCLARTSLNGADLSHADLSGCDLSRSEMYRVSLVGARVHDADLSDAKLTGAQADGSHFDGSTLIGAQLMDANLSGAALTRANLTKANLSRAILSDASLTGSKLTGSKLTGANLTRADFTGADLTGADLRGATLRHAILCNVTWNDKTTIIERRWCLVLYIVNRKPEESLSDLIRAELTSADLSDSDLSGADLSGFDLSETDLSEANLSEADLRRISSGRTCPGRS